MRYRWALVPALAIAGYAQQAMSVEKLVQFIESSVKQKLPDKEVASYLTGVRLTSKLEDKVIEQLMGEGAGPKTVAALTRLADQSAKLAVVAPKPAAPVYVQPPAPPQADQEKILAEVRDYALNYTKSLPNFICLQVTKRSVDAHFQPGSEGAFSPQDMIAEKLSFFDQHEKYEPISINGSSMYGKSWETLGGSISRGEFGTLLREVFEPQTDAIMTWDHWGTLRGKLCYVFRYAVLQPKSHYSVDYERTQQAVPGYHGLVYVEKGPNVITRLTIEPDMPPGFPVQEIHQVVDYDLSDISGQKYLLPLFSRVQSRAGRIASRNEIQFRKYQRYAADTTIKFDEGDDVPLPDKLDSDQAAPAKP